MFVIDPQTNSIQSLTRKTFSEPGLKERANLQEWIAKNPEALGEKLLIVQNVLRFFIEHLNQMEKAVKPYFAEIKYLLQQSVKDTEEPLEEE